MNKSKDLLIVGDRVIVMNHGMKWINYAKVIDINVNEDWAIVKWESTSKNDRVKLCDCVCFWPPVPRWGPVKHEIPISSLPLDDVPSIP